MNKSPIEMMLDSVNMSAVEITTERCNSDLPHVTHTGVLTIEGKELEIVQLSNGQRVINQESLMEFFGC